LPLSLSLAVLLALGLASWSAFREVRRGYAVAELRQRFIANVSHELKTPLALIRMYAETLELGRLSDPERVHEYHRVILREAERLSEMIQNVLSFARMGREEPLHLRRGDLAETVATVLEEVRPGIEGRGLSLHVELEGGLPPLPHDREGVTRIVWNLLDNAAKYAASGGDVVVRLYRDGGRACLEVSDRGPGIPTAQRARLLRPFERGTDTGAMGGSGLGLALVAQVAEVHGAAFSLDDAPGGGLCARLAFTLPEVT
jgi:signal transduction histidine kinase